MISLEVAKCVNFPSNQFLFHSKPKTHFPECSINWIFDTKWIQFFLIFQSLNRVIENMHERSPSASVNMPFNALANEGHTFHVIHKSSSHRLFQISSAVDVLFFTSFSPMQQQHG